MPLQYVVAAAVILAVSIVISGRGISSREFQLTTVFVTAVSLFAAMLAFAIIAVIITAWV